MNETVSWLTSRQLANSMALATPGLTLRRAAYVIASYTFPSPLPSNFKLNNHEYVYKGLRTERQLSAIEGHTTLDPTLAHPFLYY
jgi:hypothetical protein